MDLKKIQRHLQQNGNKLGIYDPSGFQFVMVIPKFEV